MDAVHELIRQYGLWVILVGSFFQSQMILFCAGVLAVGKIIDPASVLLIGIFGSWTGHIFWYYLGRSLIGISEEKSWKLTKNLNSISYFIGQKPLTSIFALQYAYGIRLAGAISFGMSEITAGWFITIQLLNCIVWTFLVEYTGFFIGDVLLSGGSGTTLIQFLWIAGTFLLVLLFFRKCYRHSELSQ